ncbi:hypothetical protein Q8A73_000695 [Channa argus]|nr:hypothetical protein Q8A73_000695 [Channa argus]
MESKHALNASKRGHGQPEASDVVGVGRRQADPRLGVGSEPASFLWCGEREKDRGGSQRHSFPVQKVLGLSSQTMFQKQSTTQLLDGLTGMRHHPQPGLHHICEGHQKGCWHAWREESESCLQFERGQTMDGNESNAHCAPCAAESDWLTKGSDCKASTPATSAMNGLNH